MLTVLPKPKTSRHFISSNQPEGNLVASLVARDCKALEFLYSSYSASLLGIVSKVVKQDEVAQDVLQESFIKIWNSIGQYDSSKGRLFTWMSRLVRNTAIDHLRSRGEINSHRNDDLAEFTVEINERYQIMYHPEFIGLKQLFDVLTPEQKLILDMVYFQGYTQLEVSVALNIPVGTIKTRIRMSIKVLRSFFI
ncbi:RNA polymerase sigma-70 factor, ECF subfamily [Pedobacter westerhofensis]|uniref:RNA polymerase sigma-70 factor, ECF subfamily n=1 Tax=Pedobacter westerhofensis TaxID=425512 RepID=A0A521FJB8_9SPHI|nr:sigma-70 family RNA polymerase sigma factor [Pedobacter westerhofensis]SMO95690.1 RNA polymerase sigma-70 factor, ECF subfamily [Pedobacter westerhofensis]